MSAAAGTRTGQDHPGVAALAAAVLAGSRTDLARAITLVESANPQHRTDAELLVQQLLPHAGGALRVAITGPPGVGKSTLIDALGSMLTGQGHRVAVLAVDPSSRRTGGAILGDRTRMARLGADPRAYIRPSPTSGTLGGVTRATREAIVLVEAAGYDVVLVETVGVGQSEVTVAGMVDCVCLLTLARTGDQLQGIKKGVLELADVVVVNKADGEHRTDAARARRELSGAMMLTHASDAVWTPPVLTTSAVTGAGLAELWGAVQRHRDVLTASGGWDERRRQQRVDWMWSMVHDQLLDRLARCPDVAAIRAETEAAVRAGELTATLAAERVIAAFDL